MSPTSLRILVLGAGVIGSVYAAWLQWSGQQVTILARGRRLAALQDRGLLIEDIGSGQVLTTPIATTDHLYPQDHYDLLIVTVRLEQVADVLPMIAANTATPAVLFLLTNALGAEQFAQAIGRRRVLLGFPGIRGRNDGATIEYHVLSQQPTILGEASGKLTPRLETLGALIRATGHPVTLTTQMDAWLKTHAIFITSMAAALDRCGGDRLRLAQNHILVAAMVRAIREGMRAWSAQGGLIQPQHLAVLGRRMPSWIAVRYWRHALQGQEGMLTFGPHAQVARGEMVALAAQVLSLLQSSPLVTPTLHQILAVLTMTSRAHAYSNLQGD